MYEYYEIDNFPEPTTLDLIKEAVVRMCCEYIEKNNGEKPSQKQIDKMIEDLLLATISKE